MPPTVHGPPCPVRPGPPRVRSLAPGARLGPRFLPQGVRKSWLRLNFTLTPQSGKSVSAGRLFAALLREEDMPYEAALQVK